MKNIATYRCKLWLVFGVFLTYFGFQTSCTHKNSFKQEVKIILQILLPDDDGLKNANLINRIKSVTLTVTSGNDVLDRQELTISENTASGTVSILPGENIKFTAEARDENNIIQWLGSTTVDIIDDSTVDIELTSIPPSANNLRALVKERLVNLSWDQNSDPDFARYELYRSLSNSTLGTKLHSTPVFTETEYNDSEAFEGNTHYYTLIVVDSEGFKTESEDSINPNYPPIASDLQFQIDSLFRNLVILFWTQNTDKDFAKYELYRSQSDKDSGTIRYSSTISTRTKFEDTTVTPGTTYHYTLFVFDTKGLSSKSNVVIVITPK